MSQKIIEKLNNLLQMAYTPYSGIKVSAILVTKNYQTYSGINIENATLTPTICAERCAIFKAISEGENSSNFTELHLKSSTKKPLYPCGVCLQVMAEFFTQDVKIFIYDGQNKCVDQKTIGQLLPSPAIIDTGEFAWK